MIDSYWDIDNAIGFALASTFYTCKQSGGLARTRSSPAVLACSDDSMSTIMVAGRHRVLTDDKVTK